VSGVLRILFVELTEVDEAVRAFGHFGDRVDAALSSRGDLTRTLADGESWSAVVDLVPSAFEVALEEVRAIRRRWPTTPLIALSAAPDTEALELLLGGADDVLPPGELGRLGLAFQRVRALQREREGRRATETALRASQHRFELLVSSLEDIVFTINREGRYDGVYGRWRTRLGLNPEFILGKTPSELMDAEHAAVHEAADARALAGETVVYDWSYETRGGPRYIQTRLHPLKADDGTVIGAVGLGRNVTEQKHLQVQLAAADRMVSLGVLAAGVAHEINNPLAAVMTNVDVTAEWLERQPGAEAREVREALRDAADASQRINRIVRDLTLFSRAPAGAIEPVNVRGVLEHTLRLAESQLRRVQVVWQLEGPPLVDANQPQLGQIFITLIHNAAQAMKELARPVHQLTLSSSARKKYLVVGITDTGCGMSKETRAKLFTPFFTTRPVGDGTGLGLSICQRLVTSLGGSIEVETELGVGSTFRVLLPASVRG
jgi:two-component system, NtrC family, sensor kinase